ncbi:MAG: filamentous hemagglutinin N-terminal domain-containing protein [Nostoc sp.]
MNKSNILRWFQGLGLAVGSAVSFFPNSVTAQIPIIEDGTLSTNSLVTTQGNITTIENGTLVGNNLFHSFKEFSVLPGYTAEFRNTEGVENIISRVTGNSVSNIEGILKAQHKANLFIINPNGIIFGSDASLQIGGSFVASTASSLNFADGTKFSAINPQTTPLLTVSVPIGLQFGATAASIRNQSQAKNPDGRTTNLFKQPVGLQVQQDKTLALVGGEIILEGGNLTAASGRIELGSVASNSLVSLKATDQGWSLGYEGVQNFQNIQLIQRAFNSSEISSIVDASGEGEGNIQVQGKTIELSGDFVRLISLTTSDKQGGDITINSEKLIVQDGAQVGTSTLNKGSGGNLIIHATEFVKLIGSSSPDTITTLFSTTFSDGNAGDLTIKTGTLRVENGAEVSAGSTGIVGDPQLIIAQGKGGNLTVNASKSIELIGTAPTEDFRPSSLSTSAIKYGNTGKINITTGQLLIQGGAVVSVDVGIPPNVIPPEDTNITEITGTLNVAAHSILLDEGTLTSNSDSGKGGNVTLQVRDLLLMRRNSQISTNAAGDKTGGNITINAPNGFIVAPIFGNSDITANGFSGSGGKITITTKNIFGFVTRTREDVERLDPTGEINPNNLPTNDITAFSQQNPLPSFSGTVQINSPDVDPSKGLVELPVNLVDASQQIVAGCGSGAKTARSLFSNIGRGGTVPDPIQPLIGDAVLTDWITVNPESKNRAESMKNKVAVEKQGNTETPQKVNSVNEPSEIVEAQGWVMDANGNLVLVAHVPTGMPHNSSLMPASCTAN